MKIIKGDILRYIDLLDDDECSKICVPHVVNIHNKFGSGFAYHLSEKFPKVKRHYHTFAAPFQSNPSEILGSIQIVEDRVCFINMFAQTLYVKRPLYYPALVECMDEVKRYCIENNKNVWTIRFGSGLAGGNQEFIQDLIYDYWESQGISVTMFEI